MSGCFCAAAQQTGGMQGRWSRKNENKPPTQGLSDTWDSAERHSSREDQRQQEVAARTAGRRGEAGAVLLQELQGHAVGPTEAQLQQHRSGSVTNKSSYHPTAGFLQLKDVPALRILLHRRVCRLRSRHTVMRGGGNHKPHTSVLLLPLREPLTHSPSQTWLHAACRPASWSWSSAAPGPKPAVWPRLKEAGRDLQRHTDS